ncbi:PAS domain-containing protein [Roseobacteraceae bacterium NS-SX3]
MFFGSRNSSGQSSGQEKIVSMDRFRSRCSLSPMRQAEAYWTALRRGDDVPARSQIDPRGLENILSQTFIVERIAPGIARFRLAGQKVNEMAGMEVRGMPLTAFFTPAARKQVGAALEQMFKTPSILELKLQTEGTRLRSPREAHMLLLPLRSDLGDVSRALGVFVSEGNPGRTSQRFNVSSVESRPVQQQTAGEFKAKPRSAPETAPEVNVPNPGFAETQARFKPERSVLDEARALVERSRQAQQDQLQQETPKAPAPRAPHLRLVVSRDR